MQCLGLLLGAQMLGKQLVKQDAIYRGHIHFWKFWVDLFLSYDSVLFAKIKLKVKYRFKKKECAFKMS